MSHNEENSRISGEPGRRINVLLFHGELRGDLYQARIVRYLPDVVPTSWLTTTPSQLKQITDHPTISFDVLHIDGGLLKDPKAIIAVQAFIAKNPLAVVGVEYSGDRPNLFEFLPSHTIWQEAPTDIDDWLAMMRKMVNGIRVQ